MPFNPSILLVDDDNDIREVIADELKHQGYARVFSACNGEEALALLETTKIDIIFADMLMPKMNGMQLFSKVRQRPDPPRFVLVTGSDMIDLQPEQGPGLEEMKTLLKPFEMETLINLVRDLERVDR